MNTSSVDMKRKNYLIRFRLDSSNFLPRFAALAVIVLLPVVSALSQTNSLSVNVSRAKIQRGASVQITIRSSGREAVSAVVLEPTKGIRGLDLRRTEPGEFTAKVETSPNSPEGLYVVHAWAGDRSKPTAVGKGSFRVGNIVADFFIAHYLDKEKPASDLDAYIKGFRSIGGNFLIAHNLIIQAGALYPSKIAKTDVVKGGKGDVVELLLSRADREGLGVLLSVSWDMTRQSHYKDRMGEIKAIIAEMHELYRHHPSLAGFYSYQEGSGTYYAPYVREFSEHVKSLDPGLLTACAPHIDDPLLAGYLSVIEELDMVIYQSAVMASYRPDNRKEYPLRRVRDFSGLGAGAKRLQNKITLTHVELFAYMEKRLRPEILTASYNDIYGQLLSAATVTDTDGISLFAYHAHIYEQSKRFEAGRIGASAVEKGLKAYRTITSEVSKKHNPLALYVPYSDFVIERWNNHFLPALDAFRSLGVPIDVLPYAPPLAESVYPYYPFHMNEDVLKRLLEEKTVLVLANVSGFQQTDSDLIKAFVEGGGVLVAFGPQIPFGRTFERKDLFGGDAKLETPHTRITAKSDVISSRNAAATFPRSSIPAWEAGTASTVAEYEDGSAAILMNNFGKGTVFTILPGAQFSAEHLPRLVRDVLNAALKITKEPPLLEITGADHNVDIAVQQSRKKMTAAIVNHRSSTLRVAIYPPGLPSCSTQTGTGPEVFVSPNSKTKRIEVPIPKNEVVILRCK